MIHPFFSSNTLKKPIIYHLPVVSKTNNKISTKVIYLHIPRTLQISQTTGF